jgi:hypothetical protein
MVRDVDGASVVTSRRMAALVVACLAAAIAAGTVGAAFGVAPFDAGFPCRLRSVDEAAYVRANEAVLQSIPVYPGARRVNTFSTGQPASDACLPQENSPPYEGFTTTHLYEFASGTETEKVIAFYDRKLVPAWSPGTARTADYPTCEVSYNQGDVHLAVLACRASLELRLDHDAR